MTINYPNGMRHSSRIYQKENITIKKYANRGMSFEADINDSNQTYLTKGIAVVYKKPTPIQVVHVDYQSRKQAKIDEAYYTESSTTDYNGVYRGYYLDFEAKETKQKTSFPLSNFHQHQIDHFIACQKQAAVCFALLKFTALDEIYLLPADILITYWEERNIDKGRKSIPLMVIRQVGFLVTPKISPKVPYLTAVDQWLLRDGR